MTTNKKKPHFIRKDWNKKSKLGRKRKKKQVWRHPKGRQVATRLKKAGYLKQPSIGYRRDRIDRGRIQGKKPVVINNVKELEQLRDMGGILAIVSRTVGMLKKIEIAKKAIEMKIKIGNLNPEKFLEDIKRMNEEHKHEIKKEEHKKEIKAEEAKKEEEKKEEIKTEEKHEHKEQMEKKQ